MNFRFIDKLGSIGSLLTAMACPFCFPFLATAGAAIGLGIFVKYEGLIMQIMKLLVFLALVGNVIAYLNHKKIFPLILGIVSPLLIFYVFYINFIQIIIYVGLAGMFVASALNFYENRKCGACKIKQ